MKTLLNRAEKICEPQHLQQEINHLKTVFEANGYSTPQINKALRPRKEKEKIETGKAFLPYIRKVTDKIGRQLKKHNVNNIYKPTKQIKDCLRSAKDKRDALTNAGVYRIPCSCGKVYIGTTKRSIKYGK